MRWMELILRGVMLMTLYFYLMTLDLVSPPIVELSLVVIFLAQFSLTQSLRTTESGRSWPFWLLMAENLLTIFFLPVTFYFMPLLYFEYLIEDRRQYLVFLMIPLVGYLLGFSSYSILFVAGLAFLASYLNTLMVTSQNFESSSYEEIDTLRQLNQRFRKEQQHLLELQDNRVQSSVLSERRRIVEEIHDLLGHQLSSAVIQIGAMGYMVDDPEVRANLAKVKEVLDTSMHNVRKVIHAERETTIDLAAEIQSIVDNFTKAQVFFTYENSHPMDNQRAHSVVYIVKEALTNINKHSNASQVRIRLLELMDKWTLLIADNGDSKSQIQLGSGIGLLSIEERVNHLKGSLHISSESGFRIFITLPKEGEQ